MNRRAFLSTAGTSVAGCTLLTLLPETAVAQRASAASITRPSSALSTVTAASMQDTLKTKGTASYIASSTASLRLSAAFIEDQIESGQSARDEAFLLKDPAAFVSYTPSASVLGSIQSALNASGSTRSAADLFTSVTASDRMTALDQVARIGLGQYYKNELAGVAASLPAGVATGLAVKYERQASGGRFVRVDHISCQIVGAGAVIAAFTGNAPGALILGLWAVAIC